ncbi:hypothetical protein HU763_014130 [Pseudomonas anuradhapurensis]|uniref:hypothetical protein n=1 Tax=Pseudomonas anuradhapurensis TaxID=485870 RepID=UPI0016471553|nr:hypothetical protein [Pseudomonas anuradhapurensis]QXI45916.1 hypothetical protein HU763_014130 [Pseudomonas anuradhapurensis]
MPSSSDHARLAYSETSSELFELFDQSLFVSAKVPTAFATEDGAAELYLVDSTYALIAQGVGRLDVDLAPGDYQVRQRVGDTESVHEFQVVAEQPASFSLPRLDFATPIPLPESTLAKGAGLEHRVLDAQKGNFRLLLWTPVSGPVPAGALEQALETLSLESFDGQRRVGLTAEIEDHSVWIALDLQPGSYVLVQRVAPGRQRCLPLRIAAGLVTSVYLVLLRDDSGREIPLELQHGAIALLPSSMRGDEVVGPLRRLEAARKALALGRQVSGWSAWDKAGSAENPLLALIDGHLASASEPYEGVLGDAERMALDIAPGLQLPDVLAGPPLLRRSWSRLLQMPSGNAALLALFAFDYEVEGSNAWFIWSEAPGARALAKPAEARKAAPGIWSTLAGLAFVFSRLRKSGKRPAPAGGVPDAPTYEELVQLFTGLVESPMARKLLRKTYRALENQVEGEKDPAVQRMFSALETMTDKTLLKAMGAEDLVRSALGSLELPKERRTEHARSLFWLLQQRLSEEDRKFTAGLIGAAGHWLWGKPLEQRSQDQLDRSD